MIFNSDSIINEKSHKNDLRFYYVGFDFGKYQNEELSEILMDVIVDFAFGYHKGIISESYNRRILKEAATAIYRIDHFKKVKWVYVDKNDELSDCELKAEKKYLKKGEFGEMILHLILRDFFKTHPLLSKIHFKDTDNSVVHGFDIIHIGKDLEDQSKNSIFLGESKLYSRKSGHAGIHGVNDLAKDIESHFKTDFLYREIALINKKKDAFTPIENYKDKNTKQQYEDFLEQKNSWFSLLKKVENKQKKLQEFFESVTIPLVCTYQSDVFDGCTDETNSKFKKELNEEVEKLKKAFDEKINSFEEIPGEPVKTKLNILLLLFPIPSKKELVKTLHEKLYKQQG